MATTLLTSDAGTASPRIGRPLEKWDFGPAELRAWADLWGALEDLGDYGVRDILVQSDHKIVHECAVDAIIPLEEACAWLWPHRAVIAALNELMRLRPLGVAGPDITEEGGERPPLETYEARLAFLLLEQATDEAMEEAVSSDDYNLLDEATSAVLTGDFDLEAVATWLTARYPALAQRLREYGAVRPAPHRLSKVTVPDLATFETWAAERQRESRAWHKEHGGDELN